MNSPDVFTVLRTSPEGDERILAMTNVTPRQTHLEISLSECGTPETRWLDLLSDSEWITEEGKLKVVLEPYDVIWLKASGKSKG
jgi:sucrose phosphorylase